MPATAIEEISRIRGEVARGARVVTVSGLTSVAAKSYVLTNLRSSIAKTLVVVTATNSDLDTFECDLTFWNDRLNDSKSEQDGRLTIMSLPSFRLGIIQSVIPECKVAFERV